MKLGNVKGVIEFDPSKKYLFILGDDVTMGEVEPIMKDLKEYLGDEAKCYFIGGPFLKDYEEIEGDCWECIPDSMSPSGFKIVQRARNN